MGKQISLTLKRAGLFLVTEGGTWKAQVSIFSPSGSLVWIDNGTHNNGVPFMTTTTQIFRSQIDPNATYKINVRITSRDTGTCTRGVSMSNYEGRLITLSGTDSSAFPTEWEGTIKGSLLYPGTGACNLNIEIS